MVAAQAVAQNVIDAFLPLLARQSAASEHSHYIIITLITLITLIPTTLLTPINLIIPKSKQISSYLDTRNKPERYSMTAALIT